MEIEAVNYFTARLEAAHMAKPPTKNPTTDTPASDQPKAMRQARVMKGEAEIYHDLFKLSPSTMLRDVGYTGSPNLIPLEHCHIFHTVDSNGRKQEACSPVGGHFHFIKIIGEKDGVPQLEISKPKKWVMKRVKGMKKPKRVAVDVVFGEAFDGEHQDSDDHSHEYEYIRSEKIKLRVPNIEAIKLEGQIQAIQNPSVDGVEERG